MQVLRYPGDTVSGLERAGLRLTLIAHQPAVAGQHAIGLPHKQLA
jgi:hypothetical protein